MDDPRRTLPRTVAEVERGLEEGLHIGAQVYVSLEAKPVADFAVGESRSGVPMTPESLMIWFSSTKAVTAVAAAQQWERGAFDLDDPVVRYVPEFARNGKEGVTVRHLLIHTAGFRFADRSPTTSPFSMSWPEAVARVCRAPLEKGWVPGKKAGYHPTSTMLMLAEIIRRVDGRTFERYVREEVFEPLGMHDCWVGMPPERYRFYGDRIGVMHATDGAPRPLPFVDSEDATSRCVPGGGGRGPMRQLGRFYEMLLLRGEPDGARVLSTPAVEAITARHRVGMFDETFRVKIDWGLGFIIDSIIYGRHCSRRTFGHGGAQSSSAFCDPERGLVVAMVTNGMPGERAHYRRFEALASWVYEDLRLVDPGSEGRTRVPPKTGLT